MALWSATSSWSAASCLGCQVLVFQALQQGTAQRLGVSLLPALLLAYLVQPLGEGLHDMKPVDRDLGPGKMLGHATEEGLRHVTDDLDHVVRIAAMGRHGGAEGLDGVFAVAWDGEDHRLLLALHVEEYRHVTLAAPRGGFVDADGGHVAQIQLPQHAADVVVHDAPQPLVGDLQLPGDGQHWHLLDQRHGGLLEQQGEVTAWPRPGHLDALDAMLRALGAGHAGVQVAVVLEEVQVPPGLVGEIVSQAGLAAVRTGVEAAPLGLDVEVQAMG